MDALKGKVESFIADLGDEGFQRLGFIPPVEMILTYIEYALDHYGAHDAWPGDFMYYDESEDKEVDVCESSTWVLFDILYDSFLTMDIPEVT